MSQIHLYTPQYTTSNTPPAGGFKKPIRIPLLIVSKRTGTKIVHKHPGTPVKAAESSGPQAPTYHHFSMNGQACACVGGPGADPVVFVGDNGEGDVLAAKRLLEDRVTRAGHRQAGAGTGKPGVGAEANFRGTGAQRRSRPVCIRRACSLVPHVLIVLISGVGSLGGVGLWPDRKPGRGRDPRRVHPPAGAQ